MKDSGNSHQSAFTTEQFDSIYPAGIENHYWNHSRNRILEKMIRSVNPGNDAVLEIGCGRGIVVKYLADQGIHITGCDLATFTTEEKYRAILYSGTDFRDLPDHLIRSAKTILLLDVIEHLEDPSTFLSSVVSTFPAMNTLIITVPAGPELWSNYDVFNGHYRRYTFKDLVKMSWPAEYTVTECRYLFRLLYWPARLQVRFMKARNTGIIPPSGFMTKIHSLISRILLLDWQIFPSRWTGTSLVVVLNKKENKPAG